MPIASFFAAAQVIRRAVAESRQADVRHRRFDSCPDFARIEPHVYRPKRHVFGHGIGKELVVGVLEDEAHTGPDPGQLGLIGVDDASSEHLDFAMALKQTVKVQQERRLPSPVRAEQRHLFALHDVEVHPFQRGMVG